MMDNGYKTFLVSYRHDGAAWSLELPARDLDDAKARLSRIAVGTIDGELVMTLPGSVGSLTSLLVAIRNAAQHFWNSHDRR